MVKDRRRQIYLKCHSNRKLTTRKLTTILISKSCGCPRLGLGVPFLDSDTCAERGGVYLFLSGFSSLYDAIHEWMTDGWMDEKSFTKNDHAILYYM
jgi:hypothetical protein